MTVERTYQFREVFQKEIDAINERRSEQHRTDLASLEVESAADGEPIMRPTYDSNVVGLALSGGGIRSASFCLGALQALDKADVLNRVDYLSTVSGGGYIGASLSAAMSCSNGEFPFKSSLTQDEPYPVQHIRNHSNYLFPRGSLNIFYNVTIYLRGLVINGLLILPWLLFLAGITILFKPNAKSLSVSNVFKGEFLEIFNADHFGATLIALSIFVLLLLAWGLWRSLDLSGWAAEIGSKWTWACAVVLILLLVIAFCELQPVILDGIFATVNKQDGFAVRFVAWLKGLAAILAPFSAAVAFLSRPIGLLLKKGDEQPTLGAFVLRTASKAAIYVAGAAVPFLLWLAYLYLCYLGIEDDAKYHAPQWITRLAQHLFQDWWRSAPIAWLYLATFLVLLLASLMLTPNANSLHRLYRDRLSKAFLFDPMTIEGEPTGSSVKPHISTSMTIPAANEMMEYENFELAPIDRFKLSKISCAYAPYHLINSALNIQGSKYANRRGRNADFFIFSPKFIGSRATQYAPTKEFEDQEHELDLATAMAISGAAASANMGSNSIKALTPTLAILNVRLGYWLTNPRRLASNRKRLSIFKSTLDQFYFLQELLGLMREDSDTIYLTDGGHIENLGIYELLRRRCRLIIAVDAEADPNMSFGSLVKLQRYARIDLGVLIDLPWAAVRDRTRAASEVIAKTGGVSPDSAPHGPHCAVGEIIYPEDRRGILLYIKSSITGDENDYIVDYKRRFPSYPHETTADQLFSEEQLEAYRALGFHAVNEVFAGTDQVGMRPKSARWQAAFLDEPFVRAAKALLRPR
jgi:hypothetical protein